MTTPEKSVNHQEKHIDDMQRPMIGVIRMHMTDFDAQPEAVLTNADENGSPIQPDALVLSSGRVIPKRYSQSTLSVEPTDDISENCIVSSADRSSNTNSRLNKKSKRFVSVTIVVGASLLAACASFLTEKEGKDTLQPLPTSTIDYATIPAETTTTLQAAIVKCIVNSQGQVVVESGQNMTQIAAACGRSLGELMEWNDLTDANDIDAGQILVVTPPTTTTILPPETVPTETAPVETAPVETVPLETAPPETAPVETVPLETAPVETTPPESYLTAQECADIDGTLVQLKANGMGPWEVLKTYYGLTDYQVGRIWKTDIPDIYHLRKITATPVSECMPDPTLISAAAPIASPPTTASVSG